MGNKLSKLQRNDSVQRRPKCTTTETESTIASDDPCPVHQRRLSSTFVASSTRGARTTSTVEENDECNLQMNRRTAAMRRRAVWTAGIFTFVLVVFNIGGVAFYQTDAGDDIDRATNPDVLRQPPLSRVTSVGRHSSPASYSGDAIVVAKIMFAIMVILSGIVLLMGVAAVRVGFVIIWQIVFMLFLAGQITETILLMNEVSFLKRLLGNAIFTCFKHEVFKNAKCKRPSKSVMLNVNAVFHERLVWMTFAAN